jgi:hypothetical protein
MWGRLEPLAIATAASLVAITGTDSRCFVAAGLSEVIVTWLAKNVGSSYCFFIQDLFIF